MTPTRRIVPARRQPPEVLALVRTANLQVETILARARGTAVGYAELSGLIRLAITDIMRDSDKAQILAVLGGVLAMRHFAALPDDPGDIALRRALVRAAAVVDPGAG